MTEYEKAFMTGAIWGAGKAMQIVYGNFDGLKGNLSISERSFVSYLLPKLTEYDPADIKVHLSAKTFNRKAA